MQLKNTNYFDGKEILKGKNIRVDHGKVTLIEGSDVETSTNLLVPGFVDLQVYGAAGHLFSANPSLESISSIEDALLKDGTTSFLICLATNTPQVFNQCIEVIKSARKYSKNCMGLHLEGPFINPDKRGAHVKEYIRKATVDEIKKLLEFGDGTIKMMTLAPELQDDNVIDSLLQNGVIVSLGHSSATFKEATDAYNKGIQTTTHLFNAMSPLQHRAPGIPGAVFSHPKAMSSIIADGLHVDFEVVKLAAKVIKERLFLITDAVAECSDGPYQHHAVDGKFVLPNGTLSGSSITMLDSIKNCINYCDVPLADAINMATLYPAKLIGQENVIGQIIPNADANFVVLDDKMEVQNIFFKGDEIKTK